MQGVDQVGGKELTNDVRATTEPNVLALRGRLRPLEDGGRIGVDEMKGGVRQGERRTLMVGHHENRGVERRLVTPPALPFAVPPRPALRPELVASHDLGADVVGEIAGEVVVESAAAARFGAVRPARCHSGPREHFAGVGVTERTLERLVNTGAEAVPRHVEVLDSEQLTHAFLLFG